jgi:hypothetical protein
VPLRISCWLSVVQLFALRFTVSFICIVVFSLYRTCYVGKKSPATRPQNTLLRPLLDFGRMAIQRVLKKWRINSQAYHASAPRLRLRLRLRLCTQAAIYNESSRPYPFGLALLRIPRTLFSASSAVRLICRLRLPR